MQLLCKILLFKILFAAGSHVIAMEHEATKNHNKFEEEFQRLILSIKNSGYFAISTLDEECFERLCQKEDIYEIISAKINQGLADHESEELELNLSLACLFLKYLNFAPSQLGEKLGILIKTSEDSFHREICLRLFVKLMAPNYVQGRNPLEIAEFLLDSHSSKELTFALRILNAAAEDLGTSKQGLLRCINKALLSHRLLEYLKSNYKIQKEFFRLCSALLDCDDSFTHEINTLIHPIQVQEKAKSELDILVQKLESKKTPTILDNKNNKNHKKENCTIS